ncbi:MAG: nucleotide exchange factor GrpE [Lachnospiraceae bacterium]|nr:nucleotide exchange factor GrpE [Lachnospiraceae bacterium]
MEVADKKNVSEETVDTENFDTEEVTEEATEALDAEEATEDVSQETDSEEPEELEEGSESEDSQEKGKLFKKKKDKKDEKIEELNDKVMRQMAEFENFRKRTEKEKTQMFEVGAKSIIEKILPVVDNFERGLAGVDENNEDPFAQGMQMVYKQLMTSLEEAGVTPIEAVGQEFNPDFHNAVMHVEDDNFGENEVVEELQRGYQYRDTVVRHSMVKVAN